MSEILNNKNIKQQFNDKTTILNPNDVKETFWQKIFGNKAFIIMMFALFIPSALQQLVTTAVTYVDTFFIAGFAPNSFSGFDLSSVSSGSVAKTAVGISTSIINFPLMVVLGVTSGIGIVTAQYYGAKEKSELQQTILLKIIIGLLMVLPFIISMMVVPEAIVSLTRNLWVDDSVKNYDWFVQKASSTYLFWSGPSFIFIVLTYSLSYAYREIGKPKFALIAAVVSMCGNIIMDPLLIVFEKDLNNAIRNIALSTLACRFIEFSVLVLCIYIKKEQYLIISKFKIEWKVFKNTIKNSWQAIANDSLYGFATLFLVMCLLVYSSTYHDAFSTVSIIIQFASVIFPGMAASCAVLIGNELGKDNIKQAKKNSFYLIIWGSIITFFFALILFILSWFINPILSPEPTHNLLSQNDITQWQDNQRLAQRSEWIMMPIIFSQGLFSILYFAIKSGGSKFIFFTDGFVMSLWCIIFGSLVYTKTINENNMKPELMFFLIELNQLAKAILAFFFYKWSNWAVNITDKKELQKNN